MPKLKCFSSVCRQVTLPAEDTKRRLSILSVIANVGCSIHESYTDKAWIYEDDLATVYV